MGSCKEAGNDVSNETPSEHPQLKKKHQKGKNASPSEFGDDPDPQEIHLPKFHFLKPTTKLYHLSRPSKANPRDDNYRYKLSKLHFGIRIYADRLNH